MSKVIRRLLYFGLVVIAAAATWDGGYGWLSARRYPQKRVAMAYLEQRLGTMTPDQRRTAEAAVSADPVAAMLAAHAGWNEVVAVQKHELSTELQVEKLALEQLIAGNINQPTASSFANSSVRLVLPLQLDTEYGHDPLDDLRHLSPPEYGNVIADDSYLLIAPRLDPKYRADFQRNQAALTPILSVADQKEWNGLMAAFQAAKPRIEEIFHEPQHGQSYGYVYMLNLDTIRIMMASGFKEEDAIRFLGVNCALVNDAKRSDASWATRLNAMQMIMGPDGHTSLFQFALKDPSVYWLITHDMSADRSDSTTILKHYAGSSIPAVLTKYAQPPELLTAALDAMARFGCDEGSGPEKPGRAAQFINYYQDNAVFKKVLAKQGARLIPALSLAGKEWLQKFSENPKDIGTYVDSIGKPVGKPKWTWLPGGNICYVIKKGANGQTITAGDWRWAVFDGAFFFVPIPGADLLADTAGDFVAGAVGKGGSKLVEKEVTEESVDLATRTITRVGLEGGTDTAVEETLDYGTQIVVSDAAETAVRVEAGGLLRAAGRATVTTAIWSAEHPVQTLVYTTAVGFGSKYLLMSHAQRALFWHNLWVASETEAARAFTAAAQAAAGIPGHTIEAVWKEASELANEYPMLAWAFYAAAASLTIFVIVIPLLVLRLLLPEVYRTLIATIRAVVLGAAWPLRQSWRYFARRSLAAAVSPQSARACYALSPQFISRASMRNANAAKCMPASVVASRS